jgi:hypothetical protein
MSRIRFGVLVACLAAVLAAAGCKEEEKDYTCKEAMDLMYDEDCEMWCSSYGSTIYVDTCSWYDDNDPANFTESMANDICDYIEDVAEDEGCEKEFQKLLNCLAKNADDDCAEDCEDPWDDLGDCVW